MIAERTLVGLRDTPLGSYLGAVGLLSVLGRQADPDATLRWAGDTPVLGTSIDDVPTWLAAEYRPSVVLSPWNHGSGYGPKDTNQRAYLDELLAMPTERMRSWREVHSVAAPLAERSRVEAWDKQRLVRELRNRVPEELLGWIDAAVVLTRTDLKFPPLLGSGGNDGRLDFSSNFHQRLLDVLPAAGRTPSIRWASDLLNGAPDRSSRRLSVSSTPSRRGAATAPPRARRSRSRTPGSSSSWWRVPQL